MCRHEGNVNAAEAKVTQPMLLTADSAGLFFFFIDH